MIKVLADLEKSAGGLMMDSLLNNIAQRDLERTAARMRLA